MQMEAIQVYNLIIGAGIGQSLMLSESVISSYHIQLHAQS